MNQQIFVMIVIIHAELAQNQAIKVLAYLVLKL